MTAGRIYADFQNLDDENRVRLTAAGTVRDLAGRRLAAGERITLYTDDADDAGNPDPLLADGVVEIGDDGSPVAKVDWSRLRHASDEPAVLRGPWQYRLPSIGMVAGWVAVVGLTAVLAKALLSEIK